MKTLMLLTLLMMAPLAVAKDHPVSQRAKVLQMDSVDCGLDEKNGKSFSGELLGTDASHKKTKALLCQEYLLESERVTYRIRPKDDKHPVLLPVGEAAQFHMNKDHMVLRVEDLDNKERDYLVVSMTPRN